MSSDVELGSSALEASRLRLREVNAIITINGNTNLANIVAFSDNTNIQVYVATNVQPTPTPDTGCTFPTLVSNAAPSLIGICVLTGLSPPVGIANRLVEVVVPGAGILSSTMTAGVCGVANLFGSANTGVTVSGNIAVTISLTGLDIHAANLTTSFPVIIKYLCVGNLS